MQAFKTIFVQPGQQIFDIALQEYGIVESVVLILQANPGLSLTDSLIPGQQLIIWTEASVTLVKELLGIEPYASNLQNLLIQWSSLVQNQGTTQNVIANTLDIPRLILFKDNGILYAKWNSFNTKFLDYTPKIRLFRYTKGQRIIDNSGQKEEYYLRNKSHKFRLMGRFDDEIERKLEWNCPVKANTPIEIDINLDHWAVDVMDEQLGRIAVVMTRKSRGKLRLDEGEPGIGHDTEISVRFALGIVISNPEGNVRPYKMWYRLTEFKIAAQKYFSSLYGWGIIKTIKLR